MTQATPQATREATPPVGCPRCGHPETSHTDRDGGGPRVCRSCPDVTCHALIVGGAR